MGKPHSGILPETTQGSRYNDNGGAQQDAAKPHRVDSQKIANLGEAEPEQPALSEELMAELQSIEAKFDRGQVRSRPSSIEAKFDELPAAERRVLLAEWVMKLQQRIRYFRCIYELTDAFIEVQRGLAPALFRPIERSGRPALPLIEEDRRSAAALAMEALMDANMSKQEAARAVSRRLGYSVSDREAWKTVAQWRDDLARAASDGGRYSDDFRVQAKIHEMQRVHLFCAIKNRGEDPHTLVEKELTRIDRLRKRLNREKEGNLSSN